MSHQIVKRGQPIAAQPVTSSPIQQVQPIFVEKQTNWEEFLEKLFIRSVMVFWISILFSGIVGVGVITVFGVFQLGRLSANSAEVLENGGKND